MAAIYKMNITPSLYVYTYTYHTSQNTSGQGWGYLTCCSHGARLGPAHGAPGSGNARPSSTHSRNRPRLSTSHCSCHQRHLQNPLRKPSQPRMDSQAAGQSDAKAHSTTHRVPLAPPGAIGGAWDCGFRCAFASLWLAARCKSMQIVRNWFRSGFRAIPRKDISFSDFDFETRC